MTIQVQHKSNNEYITVQVLDEDGDLVECNHAGAEEVKVEVYGSPWDTRTETMCDKCGVYWNKYESKWEQ